MSSWTVEPEPATSPVARELWRDYYTEMSDRWFQVHEGLERTPADELAQGLTTDDAVTLTPPGGIFLLGRLDGQPAGGVGVRLVDDATTAELKRLFIRVPARGHGGGPVLLAAAEFAARDLGADRVVLDTRSDLVEARGLYLRHGYRDSPAHNSAAYSDRWMVRNLAGAPR